LLQHPYIDVNIQNINGTTALMAASKRGYKRIVLMLLQHQNIDVNIRNNKNKTALTYAKEKHHTYIAKMLKIAQITQDRKHNHKHNVFMEKLNYMRQYANIEVNLVNTQLFAHFCL